MNAKNRRHSTALIIATRRGRLDMVEALINAGADVSVKNKDGYTALKIASKVIRQKKIARMLLDAGAAR
ncbi:MAG: ankyrin repeat domain-containing protein [Candidatus Scalindua sp.]